jgi:hypothetical protein
VIYFRNIDNLFFAVFFLEVRQDSCSSSKITEMLLFEKINGKYQIDSQNNREKYQSYFIPLAQVPVVERKNQSYQKRHRKYQHAVLQHGIDMNGVKITRQKRN